MCVRVCVGVGGWVVGNGMRGERSLANYSVTHVKTPTVVILCVLCFKRQPVFTLFLLLVGSARSFVFFLVIFLLHFVNTAYRVRHQDNLKGNSKEIQNKYEIKNGHSISERT